MSYISLFSILGTPDLWSFSRGWRKTLNFLHYSRFHTFHITVINFLFFFWIRKRISSPPIIMLVIILTWNHTNNQKHYQLNLPYKFNKFYICQLSNFGLFLEIPTEKYAECFEKLILYFPCIVVTFDYFALTTNCDLTTVT